MKAILISYAWILVFFTLGMVLFETMMLYKMPLEPSLLFVTGLCLLIAYVGVDYETDDV